MLRIVVAIIVLAAAAPIIAADVDHELIVCGWDEVYILNVGDPAVAPSKVWRWKAADRPELPPFIKTKFKTTTDCRLVAGNRILIVASDDGVALVDRSTSKAVFWGACVDAHSAELLPGDRIVVACSVRDGSNRLTVFDAKVPGRELFSTELYSAHGALWDGRRNILWALGGRELRAYSLVDWNTEKPSLRMAASYQLPSQGGHEVFEVGDSRMLGITALREAWYFDRDDRKFLPHPELGKLRGVKSVSVHPTTKQVAYTQADAPEWWTSTIRFMHPDRTVKLDGEKIYKVRWVR